MAMRCSRRFSGGGTGRAAADTGAGPRRPKTKPPRAAPSTARTAATGTAALCNTAAEGGGCCWGWVPTTTAAALTARQTDSYDTHDMHVTPQRMVRLCTERRGAYRGVHRYRCRCVDGAPARS